MSTACKVVDVCEDVHRNFCYLTTGAGGARNNHRYPADPEGRVFPGSPRGGCGGEEGHLYLRPCTSAAAVPEDSGKIHSHGQVLHTYFNNVCHVTFPSTAPGEVGARTGEEVQRSTGGLHSSSEDPPQTKEKPADQTETAQTTEVSRERSESMHNRRCSRECNRVLLLFNTLGKNKVVVNLEAQTNSNEEW